MSIRTATAPIEFEQARRLIKEYGDSLGVDLSFQSFEQELDSLPGDYAPPRGCLILAWAGSAPVGCVAVRPLADDICEMKRLYVRPSARGGGIGRELARAAINEARRIGYAKMRLDTLASMAPARALYSSLGFRRIPPYYHNPLDGAEFLELELA